MVKPLKAFLSFVLFCASFAALADAEKCAGCHADEVSEWRKSQHSQAMSRMTPNSVSGNFEDGKFIDSEVEAHFYREGNQYLIRLTESDQTRKWRVAYALGTYPLQQYLIDTGDGRLQAFNIAWDARSEIEGGQRWFRLDEPGESHPGDPMHWSGVYQNWNNQCADCHTTDLHRNYNPDLNSYDTQWKQLAVACSACHQTADEHASAARHGIDLSAGVELAAMTAWQISQGNQPPKHIGRVTTRQVNSCGQCHALRTRLSEDGSGRVHDQFSLSRLEHPLYYQDGRVKEEVFVLGSFQQSRMFQAGVVCTDCHDPHTGKLKASGNAVCTQCHNGHDFDTPDHHRHANGGPGAQCVNCHMPESTFMKIDDRREHSFMVPRPDLAKASGSPDVCLSCHSEKERDWSINTVRQWSPELYEQESWYEVQGRPPSDLMSFLRSPDEPALRRATLIERHGQWLARENSGLILMLAQSDESVIRESTFRVLRHGSPDLAHDLSKEGVEDPSLAARIALFESLIQLGIEVDLPQYSKVREEYEQFLKIQADLPSGLVLRARYLLAENDIKKASKALEKALKKDVGFVPAAILLTDIMRSDGRNEEALKTIDQTLNETPDDPRLVHLRGLIGLKLQNYNQALVDLGRAFELAPEQWLFGYRYAVALYQLDQRKRSLEVTTTLLQRFPNNPSLRALMKQF